jgi:hypothetical protein
MCEKGHQPNSVGDGCESCSAGTYSNESTKYLCLDCQAGTYSSVGADKCVDPCNYIHPGIGEGCNDPYCKYE